MKWIDAGDIKQWFTSKRRHCEQTLPELIRRLIAATTPTLNRLDFPSGDSVTTQGWDGFLETTEISPFFPSGISGWEMGVQPSPEKKADKDFADRTKKPNGLTKAESTFVFVTPRPFPKRKQWEIKRSKQKKWKAVRVIAASELESWLDSTPGVAIWLARQLSKVTDRIRDIEAAWDEWSLATDPPMLPEILTAGRAAQVDSVHEWLQGAPGLLEVQGDSPDEALAFLYAAISVLSDPGKTRSISRCVVVDDIHQLRGCVQFQQPLIIAAPAECRSAVWPLVKKGHHVFLIADSNTIDYRDKLLVLPRPRSSALERALRNSNIPEAKAHRLVRDSGASIPVLRRQMMRSTINLPEWTKPESARLFLPVLLAGAWHDQQPGDREVIETLSGMPYTQYTKALEPFLGVSDSPLRKIEDVWMVKSPLDAWFLIARFLDADSFSRFRNVTSTVLGEVNPKYDLEPEQRWAAAIYDKAPRFSHWVQQGLVKSLVLLGVYGNRAAGSADRASTDAITTDVLQDAKTWQQWSSLNRILPLLAEAAPDAFLKVLEDALSKAPDIFVELMRDDGTTFGECRHSGLLWALEGLAWEPDYVHRAVAALGRLAVTDPGGSWSNRPANSLRDIFLPNLPQTYASPQARLEVFDALSKEDPELAWKVSEALLSGGGFTVAHQFRWRQSTGERNPLDPPMQEDYQEYLAGLIPRITRLISATPKNLIGALRIFVNAAFIQVAAIEALVRTEPTPLPGDVRSQIWTAIRELLHWINSHGDADTKKYVPALKQELERFAPENVLDSYAWILGNAWPNLPEGEPEDYNEREELISKTRENAAREVLDRTPIGQIVDYASRVQYVGVFGHSFGKVVSENEDTQFVDTMVRHTPMNVGLVVGYSLGRVEAKGREWIVEHTRRLQAQDGSPQAIAALYLGAPEGQSTWAEVASYGKDVELAYWQHARGRSREATGDVDIAIAKLIEANRPEIALELAGAPKASVQSDTLQRLVRALLEFDPKGRSVDGTMFRFYLGAVFNQLYQRNELSLEELAALEWPFARILSDRLHRPTNMPLAVHRLLQRDPSFFAMLVSLIYRRDDKQESLSDAGIDHEQKKNRADNAREILASWRLMPGLQDDGAIVEATLNDWVDRARRQCADTGHVTGCDLQIAEILARSPSGSDGAWPHEAVRNVIETLQNRVVDEHFEVAIYNNRGVTTRGLDDGGAQERALAKKYEDMSKVVGPRWPRTRTILLRVAAHYKRYAKHEDVSTELRDLNWG